MFLEIDILGLPMVQPRMMRTRRDMWMVLGIMMEGCILSVGLVCCICGYNME
jgi:hypothetical protein